MQKFAFTLILFTAAILLGGCAGIIPVTSDSTLQPTPTSAPAQSSLWLSWQRVGGFAGFCDILQIDNTGAVSAYSCASGSPEKIASRMLTNAEMEQITALMSRLQPFDITSSDNATADSMTVTLVFGGVGTNAASEQDQADIAAFAAQLFSTLERE